MHIESSEVFKMWLASALAPLSDANPESLARYVYALVKKDKPFEELRDLMIDQLDVFLREETKGFVQLIFKNIESQEYLSFKKDVAPTTAVPPKEENKEEPTSSVEPAPTIPPAEPVKEPEVTTSSEERPAQIQSSVVSDSTPKEKEEPPKLPEKKEEKKKDIVEREDRFRLNRSRLKHGEVAGRERSRSRSWGRVGAGVGARRSRSRERPDLRERLDMRDRVERSDLRERLDMARERPHLEQRERDRRERMPVYRNKSPPGRRYERRRSYTSRSPSPARHRGGSRSRSRSPKFPLPPPRRFRNRSLDGRSRSRSRDRDSPRSNRSYDVLKEELLLANRPNPNFQERRCIDFELKGFCMRGELCPYDHGTDPLVVPDLTTRIPPLQYPPPGMGGPPMGIPPPGLMPPNVPPPHMPTPQMMLRPPPNMEYSPDAPSMNANMWPNRPGPFPFHGPRMMHPPGYNPHPRDLINVPVDHPYPNGRHPGRRGPGFMHHHPTSGNCCLDIKKIPVGINNITHLNNHFAKFGKIVNIQVNYSNDPEAAMITFSSPAEATAAYKSTEAVLNNRFIKVLWHQQDGRGNANGNVKERLGPHAQSAQAQVTPPGTDNVAVNTPTCLIKKPTVAVDPLKRENQEDNKAKEIADIKANQDMLEKNQMMRQKAADCRKELTDLSSELMKRGSALLDKHIAQQKELLNKLATPGLDDKTKTAIKDAIKAVQEQIEKVKEQILAQAAKKGPVRRPKEEIQKEILDTELDIISKQQEGGDLVPLYKKMHNLKMELHKSQVGVLGVRPVRPPHPGAIRHPMYSTHSIVRVNAAAGGKPAYRPPAPPVDNRPTKLLVSGYENDEKDLVLAHFREFGEIADYIADDSTPSIVLNFKTRQEAEAAMNQGKNFQDRLLTVTWFSTPQLPARRRNSSTGGPSYHMHAGRQVLLSGSDSEPMPDPMYINKSSDPEDEERALDSGEEFLLQDDDEDAEDDRDERSWRR